MKKKLFAVALALAYSGTASAANPPAWSHLTDQMRCLWLNGFILEFLGKWPFSCPYLAQQIGGGRIARRSP